MANNIKNRDINSRFTELILMIKTIGLSCESFNEISSWGEVYGNFLFGNNIGIFRDDDFEAFLVLKYMDEHKMVPVNLNLSKDLHIISTPYATGGHTRLMERLIGLRKNSDVLITRPICSIEDKLRLPPQIKIYQNEHGFDIARLIDIISGYKTIFLHIHPDDLLASVAIGVAKRIFNNKVIFVNHADHLFSFGFYSSDLVAEVSSYGFYLSQQKRGVLSSFLGIPVSIGELREIKFDKVGKKNNYFEIFSAGSRMKYKPSMEYSFQQLTEKILKEIPGAKITVIGPEIWTDWWWWKVKLKNPIKLKVLSSMPYDKYILILANADIYLDSLPMTGGTALPEIRSKDIPVSGILSGSFGYTPLDATKFRTADHLLAAMKDFCFNKNGQIPYRNNKQDVISNASYVHGFTDFGSRLNEIADRSAIFPSYDMKTIFNIDFYSNQWRADGVIIIGFRSLKFLFRHWSIGGREVIRTLSYSLNMKQIVYLMGVVFDKLFLRK